MSEALQHIREAGLGAVAGSTCDYCRQTTGDCRPMPVAGRQYVPKLCNDCYGPLKAAGRFDFERDRELFYPDFAPSRSDSGGGGQ